LIPKNVVDALEDLPWTDNVQFLYGWVRKYHHAARRSRPLFGSTQVFFAPRLHENEYGRKRWNFVIYAKRVFQQLSMGATANEK
jgi:hypothetical protein